MSSSNRFTRFADCLALIEGRLAEPAPARIQLLSGPRQVGKTTLLLRLVDANDPTALYAACDAPEAALPGFWERLWARAAETADRHGRALVLLDEIQHLGDWSARLKAQWDRMRRRRLPVHIVATGSSALGLGAGSRESLAGRFERIVLTHWSARSLAETFGVPEEDAAEILVRRGTYPGAMEYLDDVPRWSAYVRDAIVEPAVGRDLLALGQVRKPALLRQVFAASVAAPAQIVSLQKMQGQLQDRGALDTIAHYLTLLEEAYLVVGIQKHSGRLLRRRSSPPKIVVLSNALLAATDPRGAPDALVEPDRYGAWVENACLAHAYNSGQQVGYWREEPVELDMVVDGSWGRWAVEVKTGPFGVRDLAGLLGFVKRYRNYRPLVVVGDDEAEAASATGVGSIHWKRFLLDGLSPMA